MGLFYSSSYNEISEQPPCPSNTRQTLQRQADGIFHFPMPTASFLLLL